MTPIALFVIRLRVLLGIAEVALATPWIVRGWLTWLQE